MSEHVLRIGLIGAGMMGSEHARIVSASVPSGRITHVFDVDERRGKDVASRIRASVAVSALELIESDDVDAVVIASPDETHADLAVACVSLGKPVLCEKPLGSNPAQARRVVDAELAAGRRLVQVGFMRRFDPAFLELQHCRISGRLGQVRIIHTIHRNANNATSTDDATLIRGSMIHELDTVAWLLGDPLVAVRVESPVEAGFRDPQIATLWTRDGVMVTAEVFVGAGYGYDVRYEVVGNQGTVDLVRTSPVTARHAGVESRLIPDGFVAHFADAYRSQMMQWVSAAMAGQAAGPSAWDGYVASCAAEAGVRSLAANGRREVVSTGSRPALYAEQHSEV